jgi:chromosome segregation ATPase
MTERSKLDEVIEELRQQRDEMRLQLHLAKAEAREEWDALEKKWNHLEVRLGALSKEAKGSATDVGAALAVVADELGRAYQRLKKSWR